MRRSLFAALAVVLCSCEGSRPATDQDFGTRDVRLPGGQVIHAEPMVDVTDMMRGMMFRKSVAPDHGMLFLHQKPSTYAYWMYQTLIPLDIIWMDSSKRVVEIVPEAPPCKTVASECPHFGGHQPAQYVLEVGGGLAKKYNVKLGDYIDF